MSNAPNTSYDLSHLREQLAPTQLLHKRQAASTNDWAKRAVESATIGAPALVLADCQSAGRGRGTNSWWSANGNLAATFVLGQNPHLAFGLVPLLAGLAVRRALVRVTGCEMIGLKWPNDLIVSERKIAGLLCERLRDADLIGIGINVNADCREAPVELSARITSLRQLTGNTSSLSDIVCEIGHELNLIASIESQETAHRLMQEYAQHHWPTGKNVKLIDTDHASSLAGCCKGIDPQGRLIVDTGQEVQTVLTGSIVSIE